MNRRLAVAGIQMSPSDRSDQSMQRAAAAQPVPAARPCFRRAGMWAERISACRNSGLNVKSWCKENGVCEQTYYKWQKKIFAMAKAQQELQFAEVTPVIPSNGNGQIALSIHVGGIAADIHNGADPATVEAVLRILKLC